MIWIVFAPFVVAPLLPVLDRWMGRRAGWLIAGVPVAMGVWFGRLWGTRPAGAERITAAWEWVPELGLRFALMLDGLSLLFVLLITAVGALVAIYSSGYLAGHARLGRFHAYMMAFMGAMLGIVLAANVLTLYVFWELTSLASFVLIGFDNEREAARKAAVQALLTTAAGGLCLLGGLVLLGMAAGSFELTDILARGEAVRGHRHYPAIVVLVLLGAFTKSAQFPFHYWLPNAMEAPTPVSAYLHSATMVQAGIYLMARLTPALGESPLWNGTLTSVGAATMFLGAYLAFFEYDLKGVLAYLTINVLGTLTMLLGIGTPLAVKAAMVYMVAHALYKGALFLIAGVVSHATGSRDLRELGGLIGRLPVIGVVAIVAALSMAGVFPTFGFVAKELFLEAVWHTPVGTYLLTGLSIVSGILLVAGAGRVSITPFFGRATAAGAHFHRPGAAMRLPPVMLAAAGLVAGLAPQALMAPLLGPALAPITGESVPMDLALWHGPTVPFALSLGVLAAGVACFAIRHSLQRTLARTLVPGRWGPEKWYEWSLAGMNGLAAWQTRLLQAGRLSYYVFMTVFVLLVLVAAGLVLRGTPRLQLTSMGVRPYELIAGLLGPTAAGVAVMMRSRLATVAAMGVVGYSVAWMYAVFGAPDLAATQVVIESLTVILFVLAFSRLPPYTQASSRGRRLRDAILAGGVGVLMTVLLLHVTNEPHPPPISEWYVEHSLPAAHGRNVVNVIIVDFRALDTLGEITVLSTAAVGVWTLLRFNAKSR